MNNFLKTHILYQTSNDSTIVTFNGSCVAHKSFSTVEIDLSQNDLITLCAPFRKLLSGKVNSARLDVLRSFTEVEIKQLGKELSRSSNPITIKSFSPKSIIIEYKYNLEINLNELFETLFKITHKTKFKVGQIVTWTANGKTNTGKVVKVVAPLEDLSKEELSEIGSISKLTMFRQSATSFAKNNRTEESYIVAVQESAKRPTLYHPLVKNLTLE